MADDCLNENTRAEDIILGALGFGEDAKIQSIMKTADGFKGVGTYDDGEEFEFENEDQVTELEIWALSILVKE